MVFIEPILSYTGKDIEETDLNTVSIIIVNYNSTDCAIRLVDSLYRHRGLLNIQIIVVDNASQDQPERLKARFPEIELFINKINTGFSKAVNFGFKLCTADYTLVINPDTIIKGNFFHPILSYLNSHPEVGVMGPKILEANGDIQGSARRFPNVLTAIFGRKSPLTSLFPNNSVTRKEFLCFNGNHSIVDVDWVSGACMFIRKSILRDVSGFDEDFFLYWEDADFCKRVKDTGYKIVYFPHASIMHTVGQSSSSRPIASLAHFHHSCFKFVCKHIDRYEQMIVPLAFFGLFIRCSFLILLQIIRQRLHGPRRNKVNSCDN